MNARILLAALAVATIALTAPVNAKPRFANQNGGFDNRIGQKVNLGLDVAAIPAYPLVVGARTARNRGQPRSQRVASSRTRHEARKAAQVPSAPPLAERTLSGYGAEPASSAAPVLAGLIALDVAGGHRITVSQNFSGPIASLIADLYAHGYRFTRIKCAASRGQGHHKSRSNHYTGDACDFFGQHPPAQLVRNHGLRSGRDFADSMHVDNARNVGGVAFWNSVKHRGGRKVRLARTSALAP